MHRFFPVALSNTARRLGVVLVTSLAAVTLASCGGGTQAKKFVPESLVVFGDEFSLVKPNGATYGINLPITFNSASRYSCNDFPNWVLYFSAYTLIDFKFPTECPDWLGAGSKSAVMLANDPGDVRVDNDTSVALAVTNAGVDAVLNTINGNLGILNDRTMVTVSVGRADVVQAYRQFLASPTSLTALEANLKELGKRFSRGLVPIANRGARIMLLLQPGLGDSPLAKSDSVNLVRNKAALKALSKSLNQGIELGASIAGITGQQLSLVRLDDVMDVVVANYASYLLNNIDAAACVSAQSSAPLCLSTDTLAASDASTTYLWADATHVGPAIQGTFSTYVISASQRNPF